jgi:hypothetical protein
LTTPFFVFSTAALSSGGSVGRHSRAGSPSKPQQTAYALQCNLPAETTETLLVVDQFEELFTRTPERLRAPFIDWLLTLIERGAAPGFRVVLTIRSATSANPF